MELDEEKTAWDAIHYLNEFFRDWAEEEIDADDILWEDDPSDYEYVAFLDQGRAKEVIEAWRQAL